MSAKIMGQVWDLDLPSNEQIVLLALADHADHNGEKVFPSNGLVAWKCGISSRSVTRIKKLLEDRKILVTVSEATGHVKEHRIVLSAAKLKKPFESEWSKNSDPTPRQVVTPDKSNPLTNDAQKEFNPLTKLCRTKRHSKGTITSAAGATAVLSKNDSAAVNGQPEKGGFRTFVALWFAAHEERYGEPYPKMTERDGAAVNNLLNKTKQTPEKLMEFVKEAWDNPDDFNCAFAATIHGFWDRYPQIRQFIRVKNAPTDVRGRKIFTNV